MFEEYFSQIKKIIISPEKIQFPLLSSLNKKYQI